MLMGKANRTSIIERKQFRRETAKGATVSTLKQRRKKYTYTYIYRIYIILG